MPGPSGYTTAFTHPDPLDPNDAQRQRTQGRAGDYPYDTPVSYGKAVGTDSGGGAYQIDGGNGPPPGDQQKEPDRPLSVWDRLSDLSDALDHEDGSLEPVEIGPQGSTAVSFGYGDRGLRDEAEPWQAELDDLRRDFRSGYRTDRERPRPRARVSLATLLGTKDGLT